MGRLFGVGEGGREIQSLYRVSDGTRLLTDISSRGEMDQMAETDHIYRNVPGGNFQGLARYESAVSYHKSLLNDGFFDTSRGKISNSVVVAPYNTFAVHQRPYRLRRWRTERAVKTMNVA